MGAETLRIERIWPMARLTAKGVTIHDSSLVKSRASTYDYRLLLM